eukprot:4233687-Pyramimonas_sp.AAC.1
MPAQAGEADAGIQGVFQPSSHRHGHLVAKAARSPLHEAAAEGGSHRALTAAVSATEWPSRGLSKA